MGIRMAKHSYNTKLKAYRRHTSQDNLEQIQTAYKEYTKLCSVYPCKELILEPVDHRIQQQNYLSNNKVKSGTDIYILEAVELSILKSSGKKHQQHHTGRTTWEVGWQSTVTIPN